jgi:hypothetical protein
MSMPREFELGITKLGFELIDIREIDSELLLQSDSPADNVLALLAGGGSDKIDRIVEKLGGLKEPERGRALAQLTVLAGLRSVTREVEWVVESMGVIIDIRKNPVLMEWQEKAEIRGQLKTLKPQLESKFGRLPKWARERLDTATSVQLEQWAPRILTADTLEAVLGKR